MDGQKHNKGHIMDTISFVITSAGAYTANSVHAINLSPNGAFKPQCQLWLAFYNALDSNGNPDPSSVVTSGLSGTFSVTIYPSSDARAITLTNGNSLDLSSTAGDNLQWLGSVDHITFTTSDVVGCNYIVIYLSRN